MISQAKYFEQRKTVNLFPIYCSSVILIKLLVQQTIGIYCFVALEKNNKSTPNINLIIASI